MTSRFASVIVGVILIVILCLSGCGSTPLPSPLEARDSLRSTLVEIHDTASTQPGTQASQLTRETEKAIATLDKVSSTTPAITTTEWLVSTVRDLRKENSTLSDKLTVVLTKLQNPPPTGSTTADGYLGWAAIAAMVFSKILDHRKVQKAIETPGTTLPQTPTIRISEKS